MTLTTPSIRYETLGSDSVLSVPMVRDGTTIGAITVHRWVTTRPFSDAQVALLKTFADQAVIAIENVRLFTELEARNRDLTETLEQQPTRRSSRSRTSACSRSSRPQIAT